MATNSMEKVSIVSHNSIRTPLLYLLQSLGAVEIIDSNSVKESQTTPALPPYLDNFSSQEVDKILGELDYLTTFLQPFTGKEALFTTLTQGKKRVTQSDISNILKDYKAKDIYNKIRSTARTLSENRKKIKSLKSEIHFLAYWLTLNLPLETFHTTGLTEMTPLMVSTENSEEFKEETNQELKQSQIYTIHKEDEGERIVIITLREDKAILSGILGKYSLEKIDFKEMQGTPEEITKRFHQEIKSLEQEQIQLQEEVKKATLHFSEIRILNDFFSNQRNKLEVQHLFGDTKETFFLEGWIVTKEKQNIRKKLESRFKDISITFTQPEENEETPVALNNSPLIAPFEGLTKLYGMPKHGEADPTPFLAPFFFLFFGLCLTDAGYGIVLTLFSLFALKKFALPPEKKGMVKLALYCGISTIVAGAVTGSWFGDMAEQTGWEFLIHLKNFIVIFDPIKEPMVFFYLALGLGFVQVVLGIVVEFWDLIRHGKTADAIFDQLPWLLFFAGLFLMIPVYVDPTIFPFEFLPKGLIWAGILSILFFAGRDQRNPLKRFGFGLLRLYGLIGYFSDILSYSRLLALGLATAAVANVINKIAFIAKDIPIVGYIIMILLLIGGHIYNMIINFLGAAIHSLRLQFVEFFPKFFEGGGKIFTPFRKTNRYSVVVDDL